MKFRLMVWHSVKGDMDLVKESNDLETLKGEYRSRKALDPHKLFFIYDENGKNIRSS